VSRTATSTEPGGDPQALVERRTAARHLLQNPLTCKEHDPDLFRIVRRHEAELDRWFTRRLGYRLHVDGDTARLFKTGYAPANRPLRASTGRALHQREYVLLALILSATAAGPAVISLRDLVEAVRSAAAEAELTLRDDPADRRALVTALRWMVDHGLASELHDHVDAYVADAQADAILRMRPDRIVLLPIPGLGRATDATTLLEQANRSEPPRVWVRRRLVEDPVVYRADLGEEAWAELRRRMGDEERYLHEMFGLLIENRAEGVAAIDPDGDLADQAFPTGGTVGHASLLLIEALLGQTTPTDPTPTATIDDVEQTIADLCAVHAQRWANDLATAPERLANRVMTLLVELRLARLDQHHQTFTLLAAAARFQAEEPTSADATEPEPEPEPLW
jgi:uncharacterized protein (TIGR02678 family)